MGLFRTKLLVYFLDISTRHNYFGYDGNGLNAKIGNSTNCKERE